MKKERTPDVIKVMFVTREEAEEILDNLITIIEEYGFASLDDYYGLCSINRKFEDTRYGWDDITKASIRRRLDGYVIDLPTPKAYADSEKEAPNPEVKVLYNNSDAMLMGLIIFGMIQLSALRMISKIIYGGRKI